MSDLTDKRLEILRSYDGWSDLRINQTERKLQRQQELLDMAARGEPRPNKHKDRRGTWLCCYTTPSQSGYDPPFDQKIRKLFPQWFFDSTAEHKRQLLKMMRDGKPKPPKNSTLGQALRSYLRSDRGTFDPEFKKLTAKLSPEHWNTVTVKSKEKEELLVIASQGGPKPRKDSVIGRRFRNVAKCKTEANRKLFDRICKINPNWLWHDASYYKKLFLEMARRGDPKPVSNSKLGAKLYRYMDPRYKAFDAKFVKAIKKIAPQIWWARMRTQGAS
jgi:Uma2 family endonuclease